MWLSKEGLYPIWLLFFILFSAALNNNNNNNKIFFYFSMCLCDCCRECVCGWSGDTVVYYLFPTNNNCVLPSLSSPPQHALIRTYWLWRWVSFVFMHLCFSSSSNRPVVFPALSAIQVKRRHLKLFFFPSVLQEFVLRKLFFNGLTHILQISAVFFQPDHKLCPVAQ